MSFPGNKPGNKTGVTLIEMMVVVTIVSITLGISFPALTAGLAGVRLASSAGTVASFLTSAMNNVERREQTSAIVITPVQNTLTVFTAASGEKPQRTLAMPPGIVIEGEEPRRFLLFPGGTFPKISVILRNEKGARRSIQIDPVTAVPKIERVDVAAR